MKTYKTLQNLPMEATGTVLAIGNFDGVHRGHQALLAHAKGIADKQGAALSVLSFEPHPRALFRPDDPPFRITSLPVKARKLKDAGVDHLFSLNFDWDFASQSAEDFVDHILINGIKPTTIVVGFDFRFGQLRKGTADTIRARGIEVHEFGAVNDTNGEKFSSTVIRQKLRNGDIASANVMLGWDWEVQGAVFRGDRRGHELGYPTANILLGDTLHPAYGIYATLVQIEGEDQWRAAATNIGIRPMFEVKEGQIEAHILDFPDRDIYGRILRVRPIERLRGEAKFNSLETLIDQIEKDCAQARLILIK